MQATEKKIVIQVKRSQHKQLHFFSYYRKEKFDFYLSFRISHKRRDIAGKKPSQVLRMVWPK